MTDDRLVPASHALAVRLWLLAVAAMIFMTLIVGGSTRLTESGLSITEWKPVMGVIPPLERTRLAGRVQRYKAIPAIQRAQPRHEPQSVQDDLLVGMDAPASGALDGLRVPAAVPVFPLARLGAETLARAAVDDLRRRCVPWRGRLVDGLLRSRRHRAGERVAIPFGVSFDARGLDLCRRAVDRAANDPAKKAHAKTRACAGWRCSLPV